MSSFAKTLADRVEGYIALRRSLGYAFHKQAMTLRALARYVNAQQLRGPLTRELALSFVLSWQGTANGRAVRHGVVRRFCEYLAVYDSRTEALDRHALPRSRAIPPPRILSDEELASLISACRRVSPGYPHRAAALTTLAGLLASTGLRSGEALRLDRADVDLGTGVLQIRQTKFRKDRLVPIHATTLAALRQYASCRDAAFPVPKDSAFFLSSRGNRLSSSGLRTAFRAACELAGLDRGKALRPHRVRSWAPKGQTPVLQYSFTWKQLSAVAGVSFWNIYFKLVPGAIRAAEIVAFLKALRRHLAHKKLLIVWDRLPAHRSRLVRDYVESQGDAVALEFLPPYAAELNPVEYLWAQAELPI